MRPSFCEFCFCCLGRHSQTEIGFNTNFLPMTEENSITAYCVVLTFKLARMQWLVKEIFVSKALGTYFLWILIASIKKKTPTMDGCLILNKLGRRRVKLCQRVTATLQCQLSKCKHFYWVFPALPKLCSSKPQYSLGQRKRLTQNYLVQKGLRFLKTPNTPKPSPKGNS